MSFQLLQEVEDDDDIAEQRSDSQDRHLLGNLIELEWNKQARRDYR